MRSAPTDPDRSSGEIPTSPEAIAPGPEGRPAVGPRSPLALPAWREVAVPREHGGWGLTAEPAILGLIVRPTAAGALLGVSAMVAFVARTPLRVVLVDGHRGRALPRTRVAIRVLAGEVALLAVLAVGALLLAEGPFWVPLLVAAPLVAVELWFDSRSRSRRLLPELAGTFGIGAVAAAIVLAGGGDLALAMGLWLVIVLRATASIPFVRLQLLRAKRQPHRVWQSDGAQVVAIAGAAVGWGGGVVPVAGALAIGVLAGVQVVLGRLAPPKAAVVGAQQVALGLGVVLATGLGAIAP